MRYQSAPRNIYRHVILSEMKEATAALPLVRGTASTAVCSVVAFQTLLHVQTLGTSQARATRKKHPHDLEASTQYAQLPGCPRDKHTVLCGQAGLWLMISPRPRPAQLV